MLASMAAGSRTAKHARKRGRPSWRRPIAIDLFSGAGGFALWSRTGRIDL